MDKSAIRDFATRARVKLIDQIKQKAFELGITDKKIETPQVFEDGFRIHGKFFKKYEIKQREELVKQIRQKGFEQVAEEVAYTWFNRLVAIRFMEVNGYLPSRVRVLSSTEPGKAEPDIIREAANVDLDLDMDVVYRLQDEQDTEGLFKYILVKQCNQLGKIMPMVFEEISDYTELLLPDNLLVEGSVIRDLITSIAEEDWNNQVEIIGWLYQYYISEKKDQVFAALKKNQKITKENIPAATQLFTPEWIVKYMVENSLGRLWLESHPDPELQAKWKYYLEEAEQEPEVRAELDKLVNKDLKPEDIKVLDPCMGSGHILVYAFDVLYEIYKSAGYPERDIPKLILENNLYGLDIDDRAGQLAYFAVLMKARSYNRRIFNSLIPSREGCPEGGVCLNLCAIQESNDIPKQEVVDIFGRLAAGGLWSDKLKADVEYLIDVFHDAKEYGSIIDVQSIDFMAIEQAIESIRQAEIVLDVFEAPFKDIILDKVPVLVKQGRILAQKYDVVVTNPPYMGAGGMGAKLADYLKKRYPDSKSDLYAVFIDKSAQMLAKNGIQSMITQHSFMFLSSYQGLREKLLLKDILNMVHLGARAFEEISGEVVQTTAFVLRNTNTVSYKSTFVRLVNFNSQQAKEKAFLSGEYKYGANKENFRKIPGIPIAYWVSKKIYSLFETCNTIRDYGEPRHGMSTGNNDVCLKLWFEVNKKLIAFSCVNKQDFNRTGKKWIPYNKGGTYRKWYGNNEYVIAYDEPSLKYMTNLSGYRSSSVEYFFRPSINWSDVSSSYFGVRYSYCGFAFDGRGASMFADQEYEKYLLALLCCKITSEILKVLNPTLTFNIGNVASIPVIIDNRYKKEIENIANASINISKIDWDSFETSWDFTKHPLVKSNENIGKISEAFARWEEFAEKQFVRQKSNEEELNRIFIEIYGLQDELTPEVDDKDITIRKADRTRDIKSFLSYAVGCMFGRYSLDEDGLIYAGGEFDASRYKTFPVELDNVIPITDEEYFEDDIVSRFVDFVRVTFGADTLEQNLDYIAESLGQKTNETSRQTIRRYFLNDFYKDHVQTYKKRPIYWLFDSGKANGFKALIYMHRYDISTVATVRTDYLHVLQRKYEAEINRLDIVLDSNVSAREKNEARKKKEKIQKQLAECFQYDQVIAHIAHQKIAIDLDDGVKVNYANFQNVEIPQGEGKKPLKANLLAPI